MLFQGQEFGASAPFIYFADHNPELAQLVSRGRGEFLRQFPSIGCPECDSYLPSPGRRENFLACKLDLTERRRHSEVYALHRDLLRLRRNDPVFSRLRQGGIDGAVLGPQAFVLRYLGGEDNDRLLLVNLDPDLQLRGMAEPLLAPPEGSAWNILWSSEDPR
jgi:maltooligosyltrehalose trehalohydrolase